MRSAFTELRVFLCYHDFAAGPAVNVGPITCVCGDLHLENFGSYRAANGLVFFDFNDFGEALLAPALWDVSRFFCSIGVAASV